MVISEMNLIILENITLNQHPEIMYEKMHFAE